MRQRRDDRPKCCRGITSYRPQERCCEFSGRRGGLGLWKPGLPGGRGRQRPLTLQLPFSVVTLRSLGPREGAPVKDAQGRPRRELRAPGRQGLMTHCWCGPALGPTPLTESSQVTFEGAASALGGSPKASGLLLAFSCPLPRPAWAWPEGGLTPAWPRKAAEPGSTCLRVQSCRTGQLPTRKPSRARRCSLQIINDGDVLSRGSKSRVSHRLGRSAPTPSPAAGVSPCRPQRVRGPNPTLFVAPACRETGRREPAVGG